MENNASKKNTDLPGDSLKSSLILAGIDEISKNGVKNFSLRRVASSCGVSCAAPYKHFKDKNELILEIIAYINAEWHDKQDRLLKTYPDASPRFLLTEISTAYIGFLLDNPKFRSLIMIDNSFLSSEQRKEILNLSRISCDLIHKYCISVGMAPETERRKTFVVRSAIYGAALMLDNGELEKNEEVFGMIRSVIDREFDLP